MERKDRKRKRESLRESDSEEEEEENHQMAKLNSLQNNVKKAIDKVDTAKNLDENKLRVMLVGVAVSMQWVSSGDS